MMELDREVENLGRATLEAGGIVPMVPPVDQSGPPCRRDHVHLTRRERMQWAVLLTGVCVIYFAVGLFVGWVQWGRG